jgi:hypothetical protein
MKYFKRFAWGFVFAMAAGLLSGCAEMADEAQHY